MSNISGKQKLLLLFSGAICITIGIMLLYNIRFGTDKLGEQMGRLVITLGLMYFTFRGFGIPRWLLTIVYLIGAVTVFRKYLIPDSIDEFWPLWIALIVFDLFFAAYLNLSPALRDYFASCKNPDS